MAHNENSVQVDLAVQWMTRKVIPGSKLLEVFEMNKRSGVVLTEVASVKEVHVNRGGDNSMRRKQLAEIQVSGGGILQRAMVTVRKHGERERASPAGYDHMAIERHVRIGKRPCRTGAKIRECRDVDPRGDVRRIRRVVDHVLAQGASVSERRRAVDDRVELKGPVECGII